jgi:hypothetical protein
LSSSSSSINSVVISVESNLDLRCAWMPRLMSVYGLPVLVDGLQAVSSVVSERAFTPEIWAHSFRRSAAAAWFSNIAGLQAYPLNIGSWTAAGS